MSFFVEMVRAILGFKAAAPKDEFATLDPDDVVGLWRADHDIDQAERAGDIKVGYAKYGIKSEAHWDAVKASFYRRHGTTPEYSLAASTANFEAQLDDLEARDGGSGYTMPREYFTPIEGVTLAQLVIATVRMEVSGPAVLSQLGMDASKLERARSGWTARLSGNGDPMAGAMLGGLYHTYQAQARAAIHA